MHLYPTILRFLQRKAFLMSDLSVTRRYITDYVNGQGSSGTVVTSSVQPLLPVCTCTVGFVDTCRASDSFKTY
jgi:hypothetical protein